MKTGVSLLFQSGADWDRFEAAERGENVPSKPAIPDYQIYAEELAMAHVVEDLGYDSVWAVEHHVSPYTMVTNPLQLLAYFAGSLRRVDLGTMVVVLPWWNPLRVAEDIVGLFNLLDGTGRRPIIGLGRGAGRREFSAIGVDMNESRQRFNEAVDVIKLAISQDRFSYDGEIYKYSNLELRPQPRDPQAILESLWVSANNAHTMPIVAKLGLKPLLVPQKSWVDIQTDLDIYSDAREGAGYGPVRPIPVVWVYCHEDERMAREGAMRYLAEYADTALRNYEFTGTHFKDTKGYEHYAVQAERMRAASDSALAEVFFDHHVWGTPQMCIDKLAAINELLHVEEFLLVFRYGSMPVEEGIRNMSLFGESALAAVQGMPQLEPKLANNVVVP